MKYCNNCKWHELNTEWNEPKYQAKYARCSNPNTMENEFRKKECSDLRTGNFLTLFLFKQLCGKKARYFEPKDVK